MNAPLQSAPSAARAAALARLAGLLVGRARPWWTRLLLALGFVGLAALARYLLLGDIGRSNAYITFFPAVMFAALYGGATAGVCATILSAALSFLWVQGGSLSPPEALAFGVFTATSLFLSALSELLHRTVALLRAEACDRQGAEAALRDSEIRAHAILTNLHDAVLLTRPDGTILSANPAACRLFGRTEEELCRVGRAGLVDTSDPRLAPLLAERARVGRVRGALTLVHRDGLRFEAECTSVLFTDAGGAVCTSMVIRDLTAHQLATARLAQANLEWQSTFDASRDALWILDHTHRIVRANRAAEALFGRPATEVAGHFCWEIAHGSTQPIADCPLVRAKQSLQRETSEIQRDDRWLEIVVDPIVDKDGNYTGAVHSVSDITARRLAEQERNLLAETIGASREEIYIFDAATLHFRYNNSAATRALGYSPEQLHGFTPLDINPELTATTLESLLAPLRRGEQEIHAFESLHRRTDGSTYPVSVRVQLHRRDHHPVFLAVVNDITERRRLEQALRESQEHYRLIAENTGDIVWLFDLATMRFLYVSPSVEQVRGFTRAEAAAQPLEETLTPESCRFVHENLQHRLAAFAAGDPSARTCTYEFSLRHKAGHSIPAEVVTTILVAEDGRPNRVVGITRDLTERRRTEQALRESEEKFSKIFHNAPALIAITDLETGRYLDLNEPVAHAAGLPRAAMLGRTAVELGWFTAEQRARLVAEIRAHGRVQNMEIALHPRQGAPLVGLTSGETITLAGRSCLLTVTTDITGRQRREAELRAALEEAERFRRALDHVDAFVYIKDTASRYLYANAPTLRLFGCDAESLPGSDDARFFPPDTTRRLHEVDAKVFRGENTAEEIVVPAGAAGHKFYWEIKTPLFGPDGRTVVGLLGISTDITARKTTEAELRTHTARLQSLLRIAEHREESEQEFLDRALNEALAITDSRFGYIYHYEEEQQRFILNTWSKDVMAACRIADPRTCYELDRTGVWGEAVRQRRPIILNDFAATHPLKKGYPEGHVALTRFLTIPVFDGERIVAVVGVANKATDYAEPDILQLQLLMGSVWHTLERRRAEVRIRDQYLLLRGLLESFDTPVFSLDRELRYTSFNRHHAEGMRAIYGVEIALGQSLLDYQTAEDRAAAEPNLRRVLAGANLQIEAFSGAGTGRRFFEINHTPIRDAVGEVCGIAILSRDLTTRRAMEESLRESENRFRTIVQNADAVIFVLDREGRFELSEGRGLAALGLQPGEVVGRSALLHYRDDAPVLAVLRAALDGHTSKRIVHLGRQVFDLFVTPRLDSARSVTGVIGLATDITARVRAEESLHAANENLEHTVRERTAALLAANERLRELDRLKSEFLSTMSHELRTPLNSIVGFTGILVKGLAGPLNPEQQKQLGLVQSSARHLLALINDLLDLSRVESGRMEFQREAFDFAGVVAEVASFLTPLAQEKGLALATRCVPAQLPLVGDRRRSLQILLNLATNAVKFTSRGEVELTAELVGGHLHVAVRDTGIGIRPDQLPLLFEAFRQLDASHRRHYEGTGLGLHLSKKLLGLLGGEISVVSEPGVGSTFTFTLPLGATFGSALSSDGGSGITPDIPPPSTP